MSKKTLHLKKGSTFFLNKKDAKQSLDLYNWLYKELTFLQVPIPNSTCCSGNLFLKGDIFVKQPFSKTDSGFSMRRWLVKQLKKYSITIPNTNPCCDQHSDIKIFKGYITYSDDKGYSLEKWLKQSFTKMGIAYLDECCS